MSRQITPHTKINLLCRDFKKRPWPWDNTLLLNILAERKYLSKHIGKNHRLHKKQQQTNKQKKKQIYDKLVNSEEKDPSILWNVVESLKEKVTDQNFLNITPSIKMD